MREITLTLPAVPLSGPAAFTDLIALRPLIGTFWRHFKGTVYRITGFCRSAADLSLLVQYARESPCGPDPYARPWGEFLEELADYPWTDKAGVERRFTGRRFTPVDGHDGIDQRGAAG